jgi:transcriptional regulator with XRE-family HTH domain
MQCSGQGGYVETLREFRRRRGWSQKDLADESGVGQDTISGIESGRHEPRPSTLRKLADALDVEVADFFRKPALPLAEAPREAGLSRNEAVYEEAIDEFTQRHYGPSIIAQGWDRLTERWTQRLEKGDFDQRELAILLETLENLAMGMEANAAAERKELVASYGVDAARDMSLLRPAINRLGLLVGKILEEAEKAKIPVEPRDNVASLADHAKRKVS